MSEIFSNFFILYGKKWKKKGKDSYAFRSCFNQISKSQLFLFRVFKFHFAKCEGVPGLSLLINKLLLQEISPGN